MYDPFADFVHHTLPNGLEVHALYWDRPWIGFEIVIHSGAREDPVELPGLMHFVEHVLPGNIPGRVHEEANEFFERCGGYARWGSSYYYATQYRFWIPAEEGVVSEALSIFGSMLLESRLDQDVERQRMVIEREFNRSYPHSHQLLWEMERRKSLFKGHRLETYNCPLGRPEGFLHVTQDQLQSFYDTHFVPANMSMVIVGGIKKGEEIDLLQSSPFGKPKSGRRNPLPEPLLVLPVPEVQERIVKVSDFSSFQIDQAEFVARWAFPATISSEARRVFSSMLWFLLNEEIREKRSLSYSISANYNNFLDVCEYAISTNVAPRAAFYIGDIVRSCISAIPQRQDLFERKLESMLKKWSMLDLSGEDIASNVSGELRQYHQIFTTQEDIDYLRKVKMDDIVEAAEALRPSQQYTFIAHP